MNNITFVNLTDIDIIIRTLSGDTITLPAPPENVKLPKVTNQVIKTDTIGDVVYDVRFKHPEIKNLPAPRANTVYLVSGMISEVAERDDVLTPSEIGSIRVKGRTVVYCRLTRYTRRYKKKEE